MKFGNFLKYFKHPKFMIAHSHEYDTRCNGIVVYQNNEHYDLDFTDKNLVCLDYYLNDPNVHHIIYRISYPSLKFFVGDLLTQILHTDYVLPAELIYDSLVEYVDSENMPTSDVGDIFNNTALYVLLKDEEFISSKISKRCIVYKPPKEPLTVVLLRPTDRDILNFIKLSNIEPIGYLYSDTTKGGKHFYDAAYKLATLFPELKDQEI